MIIKLLDCYIKTIEKILLRIFFSRARVYTYNISSKFQVQNSKLTNIALNRQILNTIFQSIVSHKILVLSSIIILLGAPLAFFTFTHQKTAEAAWFDDNWLYRKSIAVTNNTTQETNKYISVTLDTSDTTKFQGDCGDLRFTKANGQDLAYYIVSGCTTASTVIHVNFDVFPAGAQTIYYYYGNSTVENGFSSSDFSSVATNYTVGSLGSEEKSAGPVAYWKFDEGQGSYANDSTVNNSSNRGTLTSSPVWASEDQCISGKCIKFNGSSGYINIPSGGNIDYNGPFSISLWFYGNSFSSPDAPELYRVSIAGASKWVTLRVGYNNELEFMVRGDTNDIEINSPNNYISENKWYHVTAVYNPTGTTMMFINGVQMPNTSSTNAGTITKSGATTIGVGFNGWEWNGKIDEIKVYQYARSAAQAKAEYLAKNSGSVKGTSAALGASSKNKDAFSNGLVGYWKMDETSWNGTAGEVIDSSGNGNNGTAGCAGTCTKPTTVSGKFGNAGGFGDTGVDDYATSADSSSLSVTGQGLTLSAWINPDDNTQVDIIHKDSHYTLAINNQCITYADSITWSYATIGCYGSISTGSWQHITVTFDGNTIYFYKDGVQIGSKTRSGSLSDNSNALYIGSYTNSQWFFDGKIDEVRIYNRSLSSKEVRDLYNWAPGPIGYWNMDEKTGSTVTDLSGNGRSLSFTNSPTWITGKYGGALDFDNDDYVSNDWTDFSLVNQTIEFWMNVDNINTSYRDILGTTNNSDTNRFHLSSTNNRIMWYNFLNSGSHVDSGFIPTAGQWYHVAGTYDGTTAKVYINGVLKASTNATITSYSATGLWVAGTTEDYDGKIDEVKIYDYARTPKQIMEDMNAGHPSGGSPVASQILYWKFDEGYGTTTSDSSGHNYTGTFSCMDSGCLIPTWNNNGKFNKAIYFYSPSSTRSYVTTSTGNPINISSTVGSKMTWTLWINPDSSQNGGGWLLRNGTGVDENYGLDLGSPSGGYYKVDFTGYDTSFRSIITTNYIVPAKQWSHLSVVYSQGQWIKVYVNGVFKEQVTWPYSATVQASSSFNIGGHPGSSGQRFNGLIDEVKVYNDELTSDEILLDYNRGSAMVLGTMSDTSGLTGGSVASSSANAQYCVPGDTSVCSAPVGEWNFEEGTGQYVNDANNSNQGTWSNGTGVGNWVSGKIGKAGSFNGNSDYVNTGNGSSLDLGASGGAGTIEVWFKTTKLTREAFVFHVNPSSPWQGYGFAISQNTGTRKLAFWSSNGAGSWVDADSKIVTDGVWHHGVVTFSGTSCTFYVDGQYDGTKTISPVGSYSTNFQIGLTNGYTDYFNGLIDQVRVFNYARTPAQIAWDYNRGGPVGHWKLDECQGLNVNDSSGNGNTGTITIGATVPQSTAGTCTDGLSTSAWYNGRTGKYNSSLNFDGVDDYVNATYSTSYDVTTSGTTYSLWLKPGETLTANIPGTEKYRVFVSSYNCTGNKGLNIGYDGTANGRLYAAVNASTIVTSTAQTLNTSTWYHVVYVLYANSTSSKIYLNGVNITNSGSSVSFIATDLNLNIGRQASNGCSSNYRYTNGSLDDVKILNYPLTPTQIKQLYNSSSALQFGPVTGTP